MKLLLFLTAAFSAAPILQQPPRHKVYIALKNSFVYDKSKLQILDYQRMSRARFERTSDSTFSLVVITPGEFDLQLTTNKGPLMLHCEALFLPDPAVVGQDKINEIATAVRRVAIP